MGKLRQFFTELSVHDTSDFFFFFFFLLSDNNLSKHQWFFTKLGMCIDIIKIRLGITNGQMSSILTELSARDTSEFSFQDNNLSKSQQIFTKLYM